MSRNRKYSSAAVRDRAARDRAMSRLAATPIGSQHAAVTLAQRFVDVQKSVDTAESYGTALVRYFNHCAAHGIDPFSESKLDANAFITAETNGGFAPASVGLRLTALRSFFRTAIDEELVAKNPFAHVRMPDTAPVTKTPSINSEQADRLALVCEEALADRSIERQRNGAFVYLMFRTGPRSNEMAQGCWGHLVDGPAGLVWQVHGKGNRWSPLFLPTDVSDILGQWRTALEAAIGRPVSAKDVIVPNIGRREGLRSEAAEGPLEGVSATYVSRVYKAFLAEIGVEGPRFAGHSARATAATLGYDATHDLVAVQQMLRHKSPVMTQRYVGDRPSPAAAWMPHTRRNDETEAA